MTAPAPAPPKPALPRLPPFVRDGAIVRWRGVAYRVVVRGAVTARLRGPRGRVVDLVEERNGLVAETALGRRLGLVLELELVNGS